MEDYKISAAARQSSHLGPRAPPGAPAGLSRAAPPPSLPPPAPPADPPLAGAPRVTSARTMQAHAIDPKQDVERLIQEIIARGSNYDTEALEPLYHDDLQIVRVAADGSLRITDKSATLRFFRTMRESGSPPLSQDARIHVVQVGAERAHAIVLREMRTEGMPRRLVFSLECTRTAGRWQVSREVAVAQG